MKLLLFTALPIVPVILSQFDIAKAAPFSFPPLGDFELTAGMVTTLSVVVVTYVVYEVLAYFEVTKVAIPILLVFLVFLISFGAYLGFGTTYIRLLPIPGQGEGKVQVVSIGSERTDFARKLGDKSDVELLRYRGADEEEIQKLWTIASIRTARIELWSTYTLIVISWVAFFCVLAFRHASQEAADRAAKKNAQNQRA